jgi:uncharacterized surface protein with fasciclin (FAS1) repeats
METSIVYLGGEMLVNRIVRFAAGIIMGISVLNAPAMADQHQKDIIDTAAAAGSFTTLVAAVQAAGLVATLKGPGPFTVFAPTDEAFGKLPKGALEKLLKPENKAKLAAILTYHVIPGKKLAGDVVTMDKAETVQGSWIKITAINGGVMIDKATVVQTDIEATNGVIHVIDTVLLPSVVKK